MRVRSLLLVAACLSLLSCEGRGRGGTSCYEASDCPAEDGELFACISGRCEDVDCLSSTDCAMSEVCDVEDLDYECVEGCNSDSDCLAGTSCQDGHCEEYGCRSTALDCDVGQFCNEDTKECEDADGPFCAGCSVSGNQTDDQGTSSTCDDVLLGNTGCGGTGNYCMNYFGAPTCYVECSAQEDCPAGFQCQLIVRYLPGACDDDYIELGLACFNDCQP